MLSLIAGLGSGASYWHRSQLIRVRLSWVFPAFLLALRPEHLQILEMFGRIK